MNYRRHRVRVETQRHSIEGVIQLPDTGFRSRTTDFLNAHGTDFIALTDATLRGLDGAEPESHEYVAVSARHIVLVVELESLGTVRKDQDPPLTADAPAS
jgi:hypothetical protein